MAKKPITSSDTTNVTAATAPSASTESKKARLIGMFGRDGGTTIAAISAALGWQPHTTRAAITGLRKAGHRVDTAKPTNGGSGLIYRIAPRPDDQADGSSTRSETD